MQAGDGSLVDGEKYTEKAFVIMQKLAGVAERFQQQFIEAELLLYASLQDETVQRILSKAAGKGSFSSMMQQLVQDVEKFISNQPKVSGGQGQKVMGSSLRSALEDAMSMKARLKDDYVSVEHLVVAALKSPRIRGSGIMEKYGLSEATVEKAVEEIRGGQRVTTRSPEATYEALEKYGRDLTTEAKVRCARARARTHTHMHDSPTRFLTSDPLTLPGREARPRHRARRGDPAHNPDPLAKDEEQPGPHRRAWGGQDGSRRRSGAAHRPRRRADVPPGEESLLARPRRISCRRQVPRGV
jgi:histone H3/H4